MKHEVIQALISATRTSLVILTIWLINLQLNTGATAPAIASALILTMVQTNGSSLAKATGRMIGTIIGGLFVVAISGIGLVDAYVFNTILISFITLTAVYSYKYRDNTYLSYGYALCGLTASFAGFPVTLNPDVTFAFDKSVARVIGIFLSILITELGFLLMPTTNEKDALNSTINDYHRSLNNLLFNFIDMPCENVVQKVLTQVFPLANRVKIMLVDIRFSQFIDRQDSINIRPTYALMNAIISMIKLTVYARSWDNIALFRPSIKQAIHRIIERESNTFAELQNIQFAQDSRSQSIRFELFKLLKSVERYYHGSQKEQRDCPSLKAPNKGMLALTIVGLRTFVVLNLISVFWIESQWSSGFSAMMLTAAMLPIFAFIPFNGAIKSFSIAMPLCIVVGFIVNYVLMPVFPTELLFAAMLIYIFACTYAFFTSNAKYRLTFLFLGVFWAIPTSMDNTASFDFSSFVNNSMGYLIAVLILNLAFYLIPEPTTNSSLARVVRNYLSGKISTNAACNIVDYYSQYTSVLNYDEDLYHHFLSSLRMAEKKLLKEDVIGEDNQIQPDGHLSYDPLLPVNYSRKWFIMESDPKK
ncbi:FUSC family protein [Vibrio barjaei]|uniref:FUSC family protein n=1 Tax=Vibrio barjaei TaxID=1676683 RepID=UPI002283E12D|nr:FUSC family protein [Vibrio barjaei]MCY9869970.1 FUSC family protein [Vibrio barjaei]